MHTSLKWVKKSNDNLFLFFIDVLSSRYYQSVHEQGGTMETKKMFKIGPVKNWIIPLLILANLPPLQHAYQKIVFHVFPYEPVIYPFKTGTLMGVVAALVIAVLYCFFNKIFNENYTKLTLFYLFIIFIIPGKIFVNNLGKGDCIIVLFVAVFSSCTCFGIFEAIYKKLVKPKHG